MKRVGTSICTFFLAAALAGCDGNENEMADQEAVEPPPALVQFESPADNPAEITAYAIRIAGTEEPALDGRGIIVPGGHSISLNLRWLGEADTYEIRYRFRPLRGETTCAKRADGCEGSLSFTAEQAASGPVTIAIPPDSAA